MFEAFFEYKTSMKVNDTNPKTKIEAHFDSLLFVDNKKICPFIVVIWRKIFAVHRFSHGIKEIKLKCTQSFFLIEDHKVEIVSLLL